MSSFAPAAERCPATGKVCWSFRQVSQKVAVKRTKRRGGERVSRYHCGDCGWWHFGHNELGRRRRRGRRR